MKANADAAKGGRAPGVRRAVARSCGIVAVVLAAVVPGLPAAAVAQDADTTAVRTALNRALETARTKSATRWSAPSGRSGTITIDRTYYRADRTPCRDYTVRAGSGPDGTAVRGTGCRTGPSTWRVNAVLPPPRPTADPAPGRRATTPAPRPDTTTTTAAPRTDPAARASPRRADPDPRLIGFEPPPAEPKPVVISASLPVASADE